MVARATGQPGDWRGWSGTMSKAERIRKQNVREKVAAAQARTRRAGTRKRALVTGGGVAVVLALVVVFIVVRLASPPAHAGPAAAEPVLAREITSVPAATFN